MAEIAADLLVLAHFSFVLFVIFGGLLVLRWPRLAWLHIPAVVWGAALEFGGWVCPLTPIEQQLRLAAGLASYQGGFIEHYILPLLYPAELTRSLQLILGAAVLLINGCIYGYLLYKRKA
jgi:hypothetical protein